MKVSPRPYFAAVRWILLAQLAGLGLVGAGYALTEGAWSAFSGILGGLAAFLPNLAFSLGLGVRDDRRTARQVVRLLYGGEVLKLGLTVALFAFIFKIPLVQPLPVMAGFVIVLSSFWFVLIAVRTHR